MLFIESRKKEEDAMELKIERMESVEALNVWYNIGYAIGAALHDFLHMVL